MRKILVVGAGQSGLQLALGLVAEDYDVTIATLAGPEEVLAGGVRSTQCLFGPALRRERRHGLALWDGRATGIEGVGVRVADPGSTDPDLSWLGRLEEPAQSVDQRVKMSAWMRLFDRNGGTLLRRRVTPGELAETARDYDLVIVAAGREALAELFPRDEGRSAFRTPQRRITLAYVTGAEDDPRGPVLDRTSIIGAGEVFTLPTHSVAGPCHALMVEAVPGGPLDRPLGREADGQEVLSALLDVLRCHAPWHHERFTDAVPADRGATLHGSHTPVVREPVAHLADGTPVLGMADTVVSNDPVTAQGANMASLAADVHRRAIVDHGDRAFDERFMRATFAEYWRYARQVTAWSEVMLTGPPHVWDLFGLAERHQETADRFADSFSDPTGLIDWFLHPERASAYIDGVHRAEPRLLGHFAF
ncbi:styrene monooxygenase/indole monooxygenase family protein [Nocardiopsis kunsanensis]|uniref:Alanine-phosphoribitol ligase n=1 Tax=Nocardiopsis kunsanensis TaxID=141693 RepID=A0A918X813_9ACTN|nr:styrene monooxygenase/indole monooxygenase family protein [Nocardiopsis kunsanensis]GHD16290.1 alanine-phosphoribitol ligase [Nocardiopsis kunsanensis]